MAHYEQAEFCISIKMKYPRFFKEIIVLDGGSLDINGTNRYLFEDCNYTGCDLAKGPNVDLICPIHEIGIYQEMFDTIISTECLEHDQYYSLSLRKMYSILKPGGLLLITCATLGRPEHGTKRSDDNACSPFTNDEYYRNLTEEDIRASFGQPLDNLFDNYSFEVNTVVQDIYFWGIKKEE